MAADTPEVLMSRLLEKMATPFEWLTPIFGILVFNDAISNTVRCNRKSEIQDGGRCYLVQKLKYKYFQFGGLHLEIRLLVKKSGNIRTLEARKMKDSPLERRYYLVLKIRYKYFRFNGRRLQKPTSGYIGQYSQYRH
jgi:hypothetical protein